MAEHSGYTSLSGITAAPDKLTMFAAFSAILSVFCLVSIIRNVWFHPLSKFPGPPIAAFSRLPYFRAQLTGRFPHWTKEVHDRYGSDVVRLGPDALCFIGDSAWQDMLAYRPGHPKFEKDSIIYGKPAPGMGSLLTANEADHTRMRRLLAHAFSEKALKAQEPIILSYVNTLMMRLREQCSKEAGGKADMVTWYRWLAFDLIGDLTFGQPFDNLKAQQNHPWVSVISDYVKGVVFLSVIRRFWMSETLLKIFLPKKLMLKRMQHLREVSETVDRRISMETDRPDFMTYILKQNDEKGMTIGEIKANTSVFLGAGSEATATVLCGATYYLTKNPKALAKVTSEVRAAFESSEKITLQSTLGLRYLGAVLDEGARMYPPGLAGQPVIAPPEGAMVSGHWIPGGTAVQISQWAAFQSASNFFLPQEFIPERWLGEDARFAADRKEAFQPFSVGNKNCIGKNLAQGGLRLILANFLWHFDFELAEETKRDWPNQDVFLRWQKTPLVIKLKPGQGTQ